MPELKHSGFISSVKPESLTAWYTTQEQDEIITFVKDEVNVSLNSLIIYANQEDLFVQLLPDTDILFIAAGTYREYNDEKINSIKVFGLAGQELRWEGQFY